MSVPHLAMPVGAVSLGWAMGCSRQGAATNAVIPPARTPMPSVLVLSPALHV